MAKNKPTFNNLEAGSSTEIVNSIIEFLKENLPDFSAWFALQSHPKKPNEDVISQDLLRFFNKRKDDLDIKLRFFWERESIDKANPRGAVDIGFYRYIDNQVEPIFTMEAKVLPTPKGTKQNPRSPTEYAYTEKKNGGIERFKNNKGHGVGIKHNAMIGYIEKHDFEHWFTTINSWVKAKEEWNDNEMLEKIDFSQIALLISSHLRENEESVILNHFWIKIK